MIVETEGRLYHLPEPLLPHGGIAEDALEVRVEGGEVQERLVDVEYTHLRHTASLSSWLSCDYPSYRMLGATKLA